MPRIAIKRRPRRVLAIAIAVAAAFSSSCSAQNLSDALLSNVQSNLADSAKQSWELGTRSQALLELNAPPYSVLTPATPLPPPASIPAALAAPLAPVLAIAQTIVANRSISNGGITGPQPLLADAAAGDPASIGMAVLLANWTGAATADGLDYAGAATDQLDYLLDVVPRTSDGAISHRVAEVQLWSDSVYMVPPFLAYYGVLTHNQTLLALAHTQIALYRNYLLDTNASAQGLWQHVVLGAAGTADAGHWATGNAWAAAGMLRVLGTIQNSPYAGAMQSEMSDLATWALGIQRGMYATLDSTALFRNYADQPLAPPDPTAAPPSGGNFYDAASTALLASTVYRLALLRGVHTCLPAAERSRAALFAANASGSVHFTPGGLLTPVVDPYSYGDELVVPAQGAVGGSPEGAAFVLELEAAWRDWVAAGSRGANAARRERGKAPMGWVYGSVGAVLGWWVVS